MRYRKHKRSTGNITYAYEDDGGLFVLTLFVNGEEIGLMEGEILPNEIAIGNLVIDSAYRDVGYGSEMVREIKRRFPNRKVFAFELPESQSFWHNILGEVNEGSRWV